MQIYNNLRKVVVKSLEHGERVFLATAKSPLEALKELETMITLWVSDGDLVITMSPVSSTTFVVITDAAFEGAK